MAFPEPQSELQAHGTSALQNRVAVLDSVLNKLGFVSMGVSSSLLVAQDTSYNTDEVPPHSLLSSIRTTACRTASVRMATEGGVISRASYTDQYSPYALLTGPKIKEQIFQAP